jgi:CRISPR-associated protein Csb3
MPQGTNGIAAMELSAVGNDKARSDFKRATTMSSVQPNIRINVDPTNPGQFFACCGLLELTDRLWPGAEGWFEKPWFCIASLGTLSDLISRLAQAKIRSSLSDLQLKRLGTLLSAKKAKLTSEDVEEKQRLSEMWKRERLHLSAPFDLWLDWWRDERGERTALKTWAAKQLVAKMASGMLQTLQKVEWSEERFFQPVAVEELPFYFDSELGTYGSARDAGFSYDTLKFKSPFRPLLELLAFIGLQRFRPANNRDGLIYSLWSTPLEPHVAAAAACGALGWPKADSYQFRLFDRTKYMKAFLPAQPYRGG